MKKLRCQTATLAVMLLIGALPIHPGSAGPHKAKCKGVYQLVQGNWIATPLCEEYVLAKVARSRGSKFTLESIRNNPFAKEELCQDYPGDRRLIDICNEYEEDYKRYDK